MKYRYCGITPLIFLFIGIGTFLFYMYLYIVEKRLILTGINSVALLLFASFFSYSSFIEISDDKVEFLLFNKVVREIDLQKVKKTEFEYNKIIFFTNTETVKIYFRKLKDEDADSIRKQLKILLNRN
ncbi:hypothetical protein [Breznakiella homolactica]|uniref:Uncharacterized protein n=1 Tax=Breznakiella homolactica TaxID=2798577 RepID=A0A7T7XMD1_9SPIR|nr:hypothetical protein [Breznakiella homolactica]QQO09024.1 hypothetical protein JFL75_19165 [Breznakiella homolactica]